MCCQTAKWKLERDREQVQDHKFEFVDVNEFKQRNCLRKLKYSFVFGVVLKSVLVYIADLWTAGILLIFNEWNSAVKPKIPFDVSKWIFLGCIFMSFILLAWDMKKAKAIVESDDISYAFTSIIAYRYYTLRSYAHYCFFSQINNSRKRWDRIAFFVFFTFKGWKRLVFAEAPRQAINAITLYSILQTQHFSLKYERIGRLLVKKSRKRVLKQVAAAKAQALGDYSNLKNKKREVPPQLREPTLPTMAFFDDSKSSPAATPTLPTLPTLPPYQQHSQPPMMYNDRVMSPDPMYGARGDGGPPGYLPQNGGYDNNVAGQHNPYPQPNPYQQPPPSQFTRRRDRYNTEYSEYGADSTTSTTTVPSRYPPQEHSQIPSRYQQELLYSFRYSFPLYY
ncbi:2518_t:CDS:2 [Ambispora gerdemannii]|uniref:2518_t:CDS:1 n=1 Tax=Ambispora gerdemannii TaxID=144530 RepID=A0A9N8YR07_9GLOM|nr:2518_t:CDS:2 [Ambispora gerdemannii]